MVIDKIKDKSYAINRFKLNKDYIKRLQINQRRYFSFNLNKPYKKNSSFDFSVDDQILKNTKSKKIREWSSRFKSVKKKSNIIKEDDFIMQKYLPLSIKSTSLFSKKYVSES